MPNDSDYKRTNNESVFEYNSRVKKQKSIYRLRTIRGLITTSEACSPEAAVGCLRKAIELLVEDLEERNKPMPRG